MSFKIKRDETTYNQPTLNQVDYGELLLNVNTGILYTKRKNADNSSTLIQYIPSVAPLGATTTYLPSITFGQSSPFCCNGSILTVTINNLLANEAYFFTITDMMNSNTNFSTSSGELLPRSDSKREIPITISISSNNPNSLIKFSVYQTSINSSNLKSENLLAICCDNNCSAA